MLARGVFLGVSPAPSQDSSVPPLKFGTSYTCSVSEIAMKNLHDDQTSGEGNLYMYDHASTLEKTFCATNADVRSVYIANLLVLNLAIV